MSPQEFCLGTLESDSLPILRFAFGRAAHDLNNYLSGLLGYFSLIKERLPDDANSKRFLRLMERSGNDMAALLRTLADFGEPADPDGPPVDVNAAVRAAVNQAVESTEGGLEPTLELDETVPRVAAHAGSLGGAIEQLIVNGFEASPERPAPVTVGTTCAAVPADPLVPPREAADEWVRIEVQDVGAGMDEEAVRRCVVPFYTTKRATNQHGLGLALVCSRVCAWGGGLDVRSKPVVGTTVSLYLLAAKP